MARREVSGFQIAVPDEDHPSHITYDFAPTLSGCMNSVCRNAGAMSGFGAIKRSARPASRRQLLNTEGTEEDYQEVCFGRSGQPTALVPESIPLVLVLLIRLACRGPLAARSSTINSVKLARVGQLLHSKRTGRVALNGSYPQNGITAAGEGIVS
jgi:hypothetical protein